jgi:N-acyl-D-amino-acid deacylase
VKTVLSRLAMTCAVLLATSSTAPALETPRADLLIRGGMVYDGGEAPGRQADVAVTDGRISFVGDGAHIEARRTIDATGLVVAPGFIDPHTHSLSDLRSENATSRQALNHIAQGVTTILVGNDGDGDYQIAAQRAELERLGVGVNVGAFVGFGAVRESVLGSAARPPSQAELARMRSYVAQGMCEGAVGFSAGLYYAPQSFSQTDEVIALAREAATRGGLYETHLRDESSNNVGLIAAVEEALRIGREAGLPVHFAHIKAQGVDVHGQSGRFIAMIEAERAAGRRVTADQYPWRASGTRVSNALIPRWTQENGGQAAMRRRLADPTLAERLRTEIADNIRRRGGPDSLLITSGAHRGQNLGQIAQALGVDPVEAARRIALEGDARLASFNMDETDIRNFMAQPWVVSSSDATQGHPRRFGSFAMKFARYVREERLLTIEQFVHRSSALTAEIFGLEGRGYLRVGYAADIVAFDPRRYAARATYEEPELFAEGVHYTIVNGQVALDRGTATGALAGRALSKQLPQGACP